MFVTGKMLKKSKDVSSSSRVIIWLELALSKSILLNLGPHLHCTCAVWAAKKLSRFKSICAVQDKIFHIKIKHDYGTEVFRISRKMWTACWLGTRRIRLLINSAICSFKGSLSRIWVAAIKSKLNTMDLFVNLCV